MTEKLTLKTFSQDPKPELLHHFLVKNFPNGIYHSAYEAGFCGYWIHNKLTALGIDSIVVNPADIPTTDKEKVNKTDKRDSKKIARSLHNGDLKGILVSSLKTLEDRCLVRMRRTLAKDLSRNKNRIKSFLYFHGIDMPEALNKSATHLSKRFMNWLRSIEFTESSAKKSLSLLINESQHLRLTMLDAIRGIRELAQS